jgi:hypothetical protein
MIHDRLDSVFENKQKVYLDDLRNYNININKKNEKEN